MSSGPFSAPDSNTTAILVGVFVTVAVLLIIWFVAIAAQNRTRSPYERDGRRGSGPYNQRRTTRVSTVITAVSQ